MRFLLPCLLLLTLALFGPPARGEEPAPPPESKESREERAQESRRLLEEVLMARLTRELALDEEQTVLMVRHLAEFRDNMAALRRERATLARNLRQAVREGKDEAALEKFLGEALAHEEKAAEARRKILDIEGLELTTWQKAKLYLFIQDFESDMRRLLKQAQERRLGRMQGGRPGGPGAGDEAPADSKDAPPAQEAAPEETQQEPAAE